MIKKKICMLGSFAVGKTSLVQQYVSSIFSDKYLTTIGVKIDQKTIQLDGEEVHLLIWDIHGEDEFQKIPISYLKGASAYFLIIDGTRLQTLQVMKDIKQVVDEAIGPNIPFVILINKLDLIENWEITDNLLEEFIEQNWTIIRTSAKTGVGVEEAFQVLTKMMMV